MRNVPLQGFANKPMQTVKEQTGKISERLDELKPDLSDWEKIKQTQQQKQKESINKLKNRGKRLSLDEVQRNLDYTGMAPGGFIADLASAGISGVRSISSLLKGDTGGAKSHALYGAMSLGAAIPGPVGNLIGGTKIAKGIKALTRQGVRNIPEGEVKRLIRVEGANPPSGLFGTSRKQSYENYNWFTDKTDDAVHYLNKTQDFRPGRSFLNPDEAKKMFTMNVSKNLAKEFNVLRSGTERAQKMSGGVGNLVIPSEYVVAPNVMKRVRAGGEEFAKSYVGSGENIMKRIFKTN